MLVSLVIHHRKDRRIEINVLSTDIPENDRRKIETSLCAVRPDFELACLHWIDVDTEKFKKADVSGHVTVETYLRLLAPAIFPPDWDRILYLDCDMVIISNLDELYDSPFQGKAVLAAHDLNVGIVSAHDGVFNYSDLGIPPQAHYFNAGVLLMNLDCWRKEHITDRVVDYLNLHKDSMHYHDQGGMNAVLYDNWFEISPIWNQSRAINFPELWTNSGYSLNDWKEARDHPKIIHYTAQYKPWKPWPGISRPGDIFYFRYLDKTLYRTGYKGPWLERVLGYGPYFHFWHLTRKIYLYFKNTPTVSKPV